jgi:hypothetical protein
MFRKHAKQFEEKNNLLDEISELLGLKGTMSTDNSKERGFVVKQIEAFGRDRFGYFPTVTTKIVQMVLGEVRKDNLQKIVQFSAWLKKDPDWQKL